MIKDTEIERLAQIGAIMSSIGITTVELAEKLKEHVNSCPGGKKCIENLLKEEHE